MKILIELFPCLKQFASYFNKTIRNIFRYKLLVPHNMTTFLKDEKQRKSCAHHGA